VNPPKLSSKDASDEVSALIETLHDTSRRLEELTAGEVDAVANHDGRTFLLRDAQDYMRHSEAAKQAAILNALPAPVALLDLQGVIKSVNEAWREFPGADVTQRAGYEVGLNYLTICEHAHGDGASEAHKVAAGIRTVLAGAAAKFSIEYRSVSPSPQGWFLLTANPLTTDQRIGAVVMHLDLTEQKQNAIDRNLTEEALFVEKNRAQVTLNCIGDGVVSTDSLGNITFLNLVAETMTGWSREDAAGRPMAEIFRVLNAVTRAPIASLIETALRQDRTVHLPSNSILVRRDGSEVPIEDSIAPIHDRDGQAIGVVIVFRDVSARERAKEQLYQAQKMQAVGQLTGGIAHDFNNLLAIIVGNLDLLEERLRGDEVGQKFAQEALSAGLSGGELARGMLAFSRQQALVTKTVNVNDLVRSMMQILRRTIGEKIEIRVETAGDLWSADTDPAQLESALVNLAINARDAMPDGGQLTVETANCQLDEQYAAENLGAVPGDYVMVTVTDSGAGIPPEHLGRVMEPFFTTKGLGKGSGLGLSMVYGFATQSGGHLRIYSEVGHGTSVRLYLPREKAGLESAVISLDSATGPPLPTGELVLVVDDNTRIRRMVSAQLATLGYCTLEASDGPSAVELLKTMPAIDLLLTDIVMPGGMSGVQLGDAARQIRPGIPILYTSGFTETSVDSGPARIVDGGQLLSKPYRKSELAEKVRKTLAQGRP
jgi:two-component system, cell cycle sensor histidine kinase and response regulator CckA